MKRGFSLIELIFAIVIIGISVAALPRIIQQTQQSNEFALKQELTLNAKTMMGSILKEPWDSAGLKQSCDADNIAKGLPACTDTQAKSYTGMNGFPIYAIAIPTIAGAATRNGVANYTGAANVPNSRRLGSAYVATNKNAFAAVSFGVNTRNDIDDYDGLDFNMTPVGLNSGDFLTDTRIEVAVDFVDDVLTQGNYANTQTVTINLPNAGAAGAVSNIKRIKVTATDKSTGLKVDLYAYSFNIGDYPTLFRRTW
ncbi:type II secretion system protein [Campylobacter geochelonis]|uniref:Prepilin-type N-terminal cleavage/methylation domain-containing protein n=1 Tax=Campylobacter geochelonis TaxID=1780362 RepID=A0A128EFE6_9BACT|nr:type II secretion system protein [Campylobacter geochelonis]QKF71005.1 putative type II secretion system protein [Campylobacter geochelonis]CZE47142.1 prepilin-type N-terminal cleavage/methylation domain-containing protein [Campylobacter geochelonis]